MFGIGFGELLLILVIILIVAGPGKLPEISKALGRAIREFKKATHEFQASIEDESKKPVNPTPIKTEPPSTSSASTKDPLHG